jgi:hypothetical protein
MTDLYKTFFFSKEFTISKNTNIENVYKIELTSVSPILIQNIKQTKLLVGLITNVQKNEFTFQDNSIVPINDYIKKTNWNYMKSLEFISSLLKQLQILYKDGYCFYGLNMDNIIVINENIFLHISTEYLVPVKKDQLILAVPFSKKIYLSPEIINITSLPTSIPYKSIYYSVSSLCFYLLFKKNTLEISLEEIKECMNSIIETKLYWFLLRGLEKRILLYI